MRTGTAVATTLLLLALLPMSAGCGRRGRQTADEQRAEIAALEKERETLRARLEALSVDDPWARGMPEASVRIGVPTALAVDLIQRVAAGFVDRLTLELRNIKVRKRGQIKKVVTLGDYDLRVTVNRVTARLKTGEPDVTFGGNRVAVRLPVGIVSGDWRSTVSFTWDSRRVSGVVCGDQDITQEVKGSVWPDRYSVGGAVVLTVQEHEILAEPVFPQVRVKLRVKPSAESMAAAQKILDDKTGVCGFVLDRVDVMGVVRRLIDKGFDVRVPTEKIKRFALPVGVNPSLNVRGATVALGIKVSDLVITKEMIWLGARATVAIREAAANLAAGKGSATAKPVTGPSAKAAQPQAARTTRPSKD